jgi:cell division protein FtsW
MSNSRFKEVWKIGTNYIDYPLVYGILILLFLGLAILFSASSVTAQREFEDSFYYVKKQGLWAFLSFLAFVISAVIPIQFYQKFSKWIIFITIVLLLLVFVPGIGKSVETYYGRNFHRWINLGLFQFQPSEFAKISIVIYVSSLFVRSQTTEFELKTFGLPLVFIGGVLLLIVAEPAFGTTIQIFIIIIILSYIYGFHLKKLFIVFLSLLPLIAILIYKVGYRKKRIEVWLDPYKFRFDEGHQLVSSFRSFNEGGFLGNPLATGYSHRYLTYSHTDFILPTFVEDYGFLGFFVLFSIFLFVILRTFVLLKRVRDPFSFLLGVGLVSIIAIQILINSFVVTGLLPITGISLPFVSYGGSSLLTVMISFGIIINITKKDNLL